MRVLFRSSCIVLFGAAVWLTGVAHAAANETQSIPLVLQATCDARGESPSLHVEIVNRSDRAIAVIPGFISPNDQAHVVNSVEVITVRPLTGADEAYVYVNPKYAGSTPGPPWVLSLAPGAMHMLDLPLRDFISTMTFSGLTHDVAAGARLVLQAQPGPDGAGPVWSGTIRTVIASCEH